MNLFTISGITPNKSILNGPIVLTTTVILYYLQHFSCSFQRLNPESPYLARDSVSLSDHRAFHRSILRSTTRNSTVRNTSRSSSSSSSSSCDRARPVALEVVDGSFHDLVRVGIVSDKVVLNRFRGVASHLKGTRHPGRCANIRALASCLDVLFQTNESGL